jgi:serine protease
MQFKMKASILFLLVAAQTALADRYMVVLKDKAVFTQVHQQVTAGTHQLRQIHLNRAGVLSSPFATMGLRVNASLNHLQALVVDAESDVQIQELQKSSLVAFAEKEVFHPAPKPVKGYVRTQAWTYELASLAGSGVDLKMPWGILAVNAPQVWSHGFRYRNRQRSSSSKG